MHVELETILRSLARESVVYVPNPGNAGDSLLAHAAYQLFARIGLTYQVGSPSGSYPGAVILLGGGGNLVHPYPNLRDFLKRNLGQWKQLIILPHTIRTFADVLNQFSANCFIFCREKPSFAFATQNAPKAHVFLSHDLAFSCDFGETRQQMEAQWRSDLLDRVLLVRNAKRLARQLTYNVRALGKGNVLNAFRTDVESTAITLPRLNIDISRAFAADDMSPSSSLHATYWMMKFINQFETVRTNRLHVGIMSALLEKNTDLHDNSYGKNRDVFMHSLCDQFSNVHWQTAN